MRLFSILIFLYSCKSRIYYDTIKKDGLSIYTVKWIDQKPVDRYYTLDSDGRIVIYYEGFHPITDYVSRETLEALRTQKSEWTQFNKDTICDPVIFR